MVLWQAVVSCMCQNHPPRQRRVLHWRTCEQKNMPNEPEIQHTSPKKQICCALTWLEQKEMLTRGDRGLYFTYQILSTLFRSSAILERSITSSFQYRTSDEQQNAVSNIVRNFSCFLSDARTANLHGVEGTYVPRQMILQRITSAPKLKSAPSFFKRKGIMIGNIFTKGENLGFTA